MLRFSRCLLFAIIPTLTASARADEPAPPPSNAAAAPHADVVNPPVLHAHPVILYIQDWGHLADVTRSDAQVFAWADSLATRDRASSQITTSGLLVGGSAATVGTLSRLATDRWTNLTKWSVAGGLGLVIVTAAISWLVAPDHSDLAAVVNEWNQRHPDRPLAP